MRQPVLVISIFMLLGILGFQNCSSNSSFFSTNGSTGGPGMQGTPLIQPHTPVEGGGGNGDSYGGMTFYLLKKDFQCNAPDGTPVQPMVSRILTIARDGTGTLKNPCTNEETQIAASRIHLIGEDNRYASLDSETYQNFKLPADIPTPSEFMDIVAICKPGLYTTGLPIHPNGITGKYTYRSLIQKSADAYRGTLEIFFLEDDGKTQIAATPAFSTGSLPMIKIVGGGTAGMDRYEFVGSMSHRYTQDLAALRTDPWSGFVYYSAEDQSWAVTASSECY